LGLDDVSDVDLTNDGLLSICHVDLME